MTLAYKRRGRADTATWTDSDSDGYRKRDDSDSDGDGDDRGRPSKGNTSKPMSQMRQERGVSIVYLHQGRQVVNPWALPIVLSAQDCQCASLNRLCQ